MGHLDADGFLTITDRKKDLIKTSGGKYVAPTDIEGRLKALSSVISQVLVHGDRRNYITALVTLDALAISRWASENGRDGAARRARACAGGEGLVQRAVDQLNAGCRASRA